MRTDEIKCDVCGKPMYIWLATDLDEKISIVLKCEERDHRERKLTLVKKDIVIETKT